MFLGWSRDIFLRWSTQIFKVWSGKTIDAWATAFTRLCGVRRRLQKVDIIVLWSWTHKLFCKNIWRSNQYFIARCLRHLQVEEGQTWGATCHCQLLLRSMPGKQHRDKEAVMTKAIKTTTSKQIQITSSVMPGKLTNNTKISRQLWRPKHKQQQANTSNISSTSDPSQCSGCPNK